VTLSFEYHDFECITFTPASLWTLTLDDKFDEVSGKVPEFGGMFLEGDTLKVYLLKPEKELAADDEIISVFGRERIPSGGIKVLKGQYNFTKLKEWHEQMRGLFNIQGVVFTDVDESSNRLKIGVERPDLIGVIEQQLIQQGIPRGAFIVEQAKPVVLAATLRDNIRPLQGGIQITFSNNPSNYYICTLGFNGVRSGVNGFVVNSHCTYNQGGVDSTSYYQSFITTGNHIGTEISDPLYTSGGGCSSGKVCRYSDSAFAALDPGVTADLGFIQKPDSFNINSLTIAGSFRIVSEGPSLVGQTLNKVGRTTGWTQGQVTDTCVDTGVSGTNIVQLCQDFVSAGVGAGDSGSPVFSIINAQNDVELRGILWGSSGSTMFVYSPIANIERSDELGPINIIADTTPPSSVTNLMNVSDASTYINWKWTDPEDPDFDKVMIYLDGVFKNYVLKSVQYYNATVTPGTYTIGIRTVDTSGNINATMVTNTATISERYINGTVKDSITKDVLAGVKVSTIGASTTSNAYGFYSLAVDSGTYPITATYDIRYNLNNSVTVSTALNTVVVQDIELVKKPTGNITGSITRCCTLI
jgi:hypothetical protein